MEQRPAVDDRWMAERRLGDRKAGGEKKEKRNEGTHGGKKGGCVYSASGGFTPFLPSAWAGEDNAFEMQCRFLKMQLSFLRQINY